MIESEDESFNVLANEISRVQFGSDLVNPNKAAVHTSARGGAVTEGRVLPNKQVRDDPQDVLFVKYS